MSATNEDGENTDISIKETAAEEAISLMDGEGLDINKAGLRLFVQQGDCASLSYGMRFDQEPENDDVIYEYHGLWMFVDTASMRYIEGSVLDYERGLQGAGFEVENSNGVSECGCGESFRT